MKFSQKYKLDRIFSTITYLHTYQTTVFLYLSPSRSCESKGKPDLFLIFKLTGWCIRSLRSTSVSTIQLRYVIRQFYPKTVVLSPYIRFFQRFDLQILAQHSQLLYQVRVDATYKRKFQKVQSVDLSLSNSSKLDRSDT